MGRVRLQMLGSGDAFGSGGRFNTCMLVDHAAHRFLIDFGASSMVAMHAAGIDPNTIDTMLISHLHGDHFGGLPFFFLEARFNTRRTRPLTIAGPPGLITRLRDTREAFFPGSSSIMMPFDVSLVETPAGATASVGPLSVTPFEVSHPSGAPSHALRIELGGRVLAYSGDTEWTDNLIPAARGADLFVCECCSFDRRIPYHLSYAELEPHLEAIGAARILLTHLGPDALEHRKSIPHECATDGLVIELGD